MALTPEGRVKKAIRQWLASLPATWFYMPVQNGMGVVGIPDFVVCIRGRLVLIEAKAPGKRNNTTPNQDQQLSAAAAAGACTLVADDLQQVIAAFHEWGFL